MRKLFAILFCAVTAVLWLTSCEESHELDYLTKGEVHDRDRDGKAPHALLIYFVGTDLDRYFGDNIEAAMRAVDADVPGDGRIVYFRRMPNEESADGQSGTARWAISEIYYDRANGCAVSEVLKVYEQPDLTDMGRYISDMVGLAPAESYGIVFGGHGSGWLPKSIGSNWSKTYGVKGAQMPGHYVNPFGEEPREDALKTRFFGESGVRFDLEDISAGMKESGAKFDYVIFDDCFMSNIESLYAMRRAADYIIASPCEVMAEGFPYSLVVPQIFSPSGVDLEGVCRAYFDYYMYEAYYPYGCVALTVCSELEALAEAYRRLAAGPTVPVDVAELQYYEGLSQHLFYDFGQYADRLSADEGLREAFRAQFDRAFPQSCRLHTMKFYSAFGNGGTIYIGNYSGVTVSEPATRNTEANRQTEWYRATH